MRNRFISFKLVKIKFRRRMKKINNKDILVSIIVPVYNGEKYIIKCLKSLLNQTMKNLEIIVINDGSTDNTIKILNKFAERDSRIKVINYKKNIGCSRARNEGIKISKGKYIGFIDSDDYINRTYYETLYNKIEKEKTDVVICGVKCIEDNRVVDIIPVKKYKDILNVFIDLDILGFPVNKLYKKEIIDRNKIFFPEDIKLSEDLVFNFKYMINVINISTTNRITYNYIKHNQNTTKNKYLYISRLEALKKIFFILLNSNVSKKEKIVDNLIYKSFIQLNFYYLEELRIKKDDYWRNLYQEILKFYTENKKYFSIINRIYFYIRRIRLKFYFLKNLIKKILKNKHCL